MKKITLFVAILVSCLLVFSSCSLLDRLLNRGESETNTESNVEATETKTDTSTSVQTSSDTKVNTDVNVSTETNTDSAEIIEDEASIGTEGLLFTLLTDGTYAVSVGEATEASEIIIPSKYEGKDVTVILDEGFAGCSNLTTIVIPATIKDVGQDVFYGCGNLKTIYCGSTSKPTGFHWSWAPISANVYWYSESKPSGRFYWHYVDGEITIWS